jgi:hypothetical protein
MTAINVLKLSDSVHLLTDGRASHLLATATVPKVIPLPHLGAALSTRGPARLLGLMALMLCTRATTFDELAAELARLQWICGQQAEPWQAETLAAEFDVIIAGIGSLGPAAYMVSNHSKHGFGPWEVFEIPQFLATPAVSQDLFNDVFGSDDPLTEMPRLVDVQRADFRVGGFAQLTSIGRAGITTRIVRDYRGSA